MTLDDEVFTADSARVESALRDYLHSHVDIGGERPPQRLVDAMAHALLAGGKRLRPLVCLAVARAIGKSATDAAMPAAVALELVHTYSLVHDDLPSLDDDDLRRGKATVHKAYDEGTAVLVGDALLTDAFALLASAPHNAALQVRELALAAGAAGMVGGQHDDLQAEGKPGSSIEELHAIHRKKTGRLFAAAAALGALAAGGSADVVTLARRYGAALGFAFQVQDDVLDVEGDVDKGGKTRGRDQKHDKLTTVRALGIDGAKALAQRISDDAIAFATELAQGKAPDATLLALARFAAQRTY